jgi:hypothetical protein
MQSAARGTAEAAYRLAAEKDPSGPVDRSAFLPAGRQAAGQSVGESRGRFEQRQLRPLGRGGRRPSKKAQRVREAPIDPRGQARGPTGAWLKAPLPEPLRGSRHRQTPRRGRPQAGTHTRALHREEVEARGRAPPRAIRPGRGRGRVLDRREAEEARGRGLQGPGLQP